MELSVGCYAPPPTIGGNLPAHFKETGANYMSCPDHVYDKKQGNMGWKNTGTKKHLKQRYLILKQGGGGGGGE